MPLVSRRSVIDDCVRALEAKGEIQRAANLRKVFESVSADMAMLNYMMALNARICVELGFSDLELEAHGEHGSDPFEILIQRIRDLKALSTATKH